MKNKIHSPITASDRIFNKFSHLPIIYSRNVYETHRIGMTQDDIIQELNIRLLKGIKAYGKRWRNYRKTGKVKPVPIKYYLQTCMINKVRDLIKLIGKEKTNYYDDFTFDIGRNDNVNLNEMDFKKKRIIINGVDVLENVKGSRNKTMFIWYMKGFKAHKLRRLFKVPELKQVEQLIAEQTEFLMNKKYELLDRTNNELFFDFKMNFE